MSDTERRDDWGENGSAEGRSRAPVPTTGGPGSGRVSWRLVVLGIVVVFLYVVRGILPPFVLAGMLAFLLAPVVSAIGGRLRVPRALAVLASMLLALAPVVALIVLVAPMLTRESTALIRRGPAFLTQVVVQVLGTRQLELMGQSWTPEELTVEATRALVNWFGGSGAALHAATITLEVFLGGLVMLVSTFYFLLDSEQLSVFGLSLFPPGQRPRVRGIALKVNSQLRRYLVGLLFLVGLMTAVTWIGLTFIFHMPYSLAIALITGFLEVIPLAGPIAAGAIAVLVAFTHGGISTVAGVVIMYFILRQLEDQIAIPLVQRSVVQVAPIATIFGVLAGGAIASILGMILAVPVLVILKVVRESLMEDEGGDAGLEEADSGRPELAQTSDEPEARGVGTAAR